MTDCVATYQETEDSPWKIVTRPDGEVMFFNDEHEGVIFCEENIDCLNYEVYQLKHRCYA